MKIQIALGICWLIILTTQAQNTYIPYELGGDNYYTFYGGPQLSAGIAGTDEFERGDSVTLNVDLTNYGKILGFKEDQLPQNPKEYALANAEQEEEYKKTTALGIMATLLSNSSDIEVKSGDQVVEALKAGEKTRIPIKFIVKIGKHAKAGEYPMELKLAYDYQDNVRVSASDLKTNNNIPLLANFRASYIYNNVNQTVPISLNVKKQADFEITRTNGTLSAGQKKGLVEVAYKNIGDEMVSDAVARLSIFKPFSSIDDQAYLGNLSPDEQKTAQFRIDVDSDATPKEYGINSEIKYTDINGDTVISESMKIPVTVDPPASSMLVPAIAALILLASVAGFVYYKKKNVK
ncbi:MAG: hypothetical protein MUO26_00700 [Methanotrichaceae archaeon]|nr:hypothetical protein [Methanotrichaceae archaeon]